MADGKVLPAAYMKKKRVITWSVWSALEFLFCSGFLIGGQDTIFLSNIAPLVVVTSIHIRMVDNFAQSQARQRSTKLALRPNLNEES